MNKIKFAFIKAFTLLSCLIYSDNSHSCQCMDKLVGVESKIDAAETIFRGVYLGGEKFFILDTYKNSQDLFVVKEYSRSESYCAPEFEINQGYIVFVGNDNGDKVISDYCNMFNLVAPFSEKNLGITEVELNYGKNLKLILESGKPK